jgi:hypothetical protein
MPVWEPQTFKSWGQRGWQGSCPHSSAIVQITLSSVSICLSLSEVDCCHALCNGTCLQICNVFYASKKVFVLKLSYFLHFCGYFMFLLLLFHMFLQPNCHFALKIDSNSCDGCTSPNQSQWHSTAWAIQVTGTNLQTLHNHPGANNFTDLSLTHRCMQQSNSYDNHGI